MQGQPAQSWNHSHWLLGPVATRKFRAQNIKADLGSDLGLEPLGIFPQSPARLWNLRNNLPSPEQRREHHGSSSSVTVDTVTILCGLPSRLPSCLLVIMEVQIYQGWERDPVQVGKQRPKGVQLRVELGIVRPAEPTPPSLSFRWSS